VSYSILILAGAARQLSALPSEAYAAARDRILALAGEPLPPESEKIAGRDGWHVVVGRYRVIYKVDPPAARVTVLDVSLRTDI
jgi:mRNA-degrading endonuclease RelE of RelBE toxin-antitoxin system